MPAHHKAEMIRLLPADSCKGSSSCFEVRDRGQKQDGSREAHSIRADVGWEDLGGIDICCRVDTGAIAGNVSDLLRLKLSALDGLTRQCAGIRRRPQRRDQLYWWYRYTGRPEPLRR